MMPHFYCLGESDGNMEASWADIQREEERSRRAADMEDERSGQTLYFSCVV
jgi:SPT2 chromatin protein